MEIGCGCEILIIMIDNQGDDEHEAMWELDGVDLGGGTCIKREPITRVIIE